MGIQDTFNFVTLELNNSKNYLQVVQILSTNVIRDRVSTEAGCVMELRTAKREKMKKIVVRRTSLLWPINI